MNATVLIIDDNKEIRENVAELLELANYKVHNAVHGKEGLEIALKVNPDIILCDIMMPELDGYGVLRGLSNNPKTANIPFIYITAKTEKTDLRKGMDLGADDYLVKPFSGDELLSMVSARLKKSQVIKEAINSNSDYLQDFFNSNVDINTILERGDKVSVKKLRKKDQLFNEGDPAKYLYYITNGRVKTFRTNEQGKEYITQIYKTGDFFGYTSLLDAGIYMESSVVIEDTEVACILKQDFYQLLATNPELYGRFIKFISTDLSETNDKLIKLAYNSARKKVSDAILLMARKYHSELTDNLSFPVCRDDISAISGISPESVSRNLTDLREERLIELQNGTVKILDFKKLANLKN